MLRSALFLCAVLPILHAETITSGEIVERYGLARRGTLLEQGIPIRPIPEREARRLVLRRADGKPIAAAVEPEAKDQDGNVNWVRVTALMNMPARSHVPVRLEMSEQPDNPKLDLQSSAGAIKVGTPFYNLELRNPGHVALSVHGKPLLSGNWGVELIGDARAIIWGTHLSPFRPEGASVEEQSQSGATLLLRGSFGKNFRKEPTRAETGRRVDCELRLFVSALTPQIRFAWRLTNVTGIKTWFQRYALRLPLPEGGRVTDSPTADRLLLEMPGAARVAVTADFIKDLGKGAGMRLTPDSHYLLHGGLDMPPDGGLFSGKVPDIHRLFYYGMSRTFTGALLTSGLLADAGEALAPVDIVLPAQYYSDVKALPEQGDPVTFGEFEKPVKLAAEWLLKTQWSGTLFWGEWYREWDETRQMGVEEASNGHSPLAPLYHYWRTGDARFLRCAQRSAQYVWDVQLSKSEEDQGRMFHTRRHLFDELDWIHPRYQRATGGLIASHVVLNPAMRREMILTIRSYHEHMFDENGVPHDWDKAKHVRSAQESGVDTSNFMEALAYCYRETGDRQFLDWALKMSRWTAARYEKRGKKKGDDWNWNLTNYVLRGLVTLYETSGDPQVKDLAIRMSRATLANTGTDGLDLQDGIGGGSLHFVFYHAWISTRIAKIAPDGAELTSRLLAAVRREVSGQGADGQFRGSGGMTSGMITRWISYYDPKSLVAYVPVLSAHIAARR